MAYVFPGVITIPKSDFIRLQKSLSGGYLYYKIKKQGWFSTYEEETYISIYDDETFKSCEKVLKE